MPLASEHPSSSPGGQFLGPRNHLCRCPSVMPWKFEALTNCLPVPVSSMREVLQAMAVRLLYHSTSAGTVKWTGPGHARLGAAAEITLHGSSHARPCRKVSGSGMPVPAKRIAA